MFFDQYFINSQAKLLVIILLPIFSHNVNLLGKKNNHKKNKKNPKTHFYLNISIFWDFQNLCQIWKSYIFYKLHSIK
ncbi:hypothetical protein BpHYR1_017868 [Brachionus plicatilis]|uniref:Uncharacterized protein n=1 Tax=Brachionus plicatilis TaxID=10195 RepID=A0A3M7QYK5_BRAPC|nr:hypothetical protein BpHYR1_017868 [Brachionus plicatilis]